MNRVAGEIRYERHRVERRLADAFFDYAARRAIYDAWPWWRKLVWKLFRR